LDWVTTLSDTKGFSPVTMVALAIGGAVCLAALALLSAYAPELRSGDDGRTHALSRSSVGFSGVVRLLRETGAPVLTARTALTEDARGGLLVLTPELGATAPEDLITSHAGPTLIVLPKWQAIPEPAHRGWVKTLNPAPPRIVAESLPTALRQGARLGRRTDAATIQVYRPGGRAMGGPVQVEALQTLTGPGWTPVAVDQTGAPVLAMKENTWTYVLADPDLLNTQGLKTVNGAVVALDILSVIRDPDAPVVFDLTQHGFGRSQNILRLMLEPPLLGATLVILALAAFAGAQAAVRFGPAREGGRVLALGKSGLADNTAGLIRLARREHRMALPYAALIRRRAAHAVGAPRGLEDDQLTAFLDRVSAASGSGQSYSALLEQAERAQSSADLMQVAGDLNRWKQELIRGRG
jgi:hypothetical protein